MAVSREDSQRRTRERLIEAAREVVARHGYGGSSIGAIVEAAGFTKGAFFSNFANKDALLLEVLDRHYQAELQDLTAILEDTPGSADLSGRLDRYIDFTVSNPDWTLLAVELALRASRDPAFAPGYARMRRDFAAAMGHLVARIFGRYGRSPPLQGEDLGNLVLSLVQGIGLSAAAGTVQPPPSHYTGLVLKGLIAAAPAAPSGET